MNITETLKAARLLITPRENWTQGALSRDKDGIPNPDDEAVCFCSLGAVMEVTTCAAEYNNAVDMFYGLVLDDPAYFNDSHSHEEVLEMFDKAIVLAEQANV